MTTIADLFKDLHDSAKERLKNPIVGTYICSFLMYNWKAIFILMFSKKSIEENILKIENDYFKWENFVVPFVMLVVYTFLVPWLMIKVDALLKNIKEQRIKNQYNEKIFKTKEKTDLAKEEFKLINEKNGNKSLQELENQIKELNQSHEQIKETDRLTIEKLNEALKESNQMVEDLNKALRNYRSESNLGFYEEIIDGKVVGLSVAGVLRATIVDSNYNVLEQNINRVNFLIENGIVERTKTGNRLTNKGRDLWASVTT